jgi:hypothetical protein
VRSANGFMLLRSFRSLIPPPGVYCRPKFALIPA